MTRFSIYPSVQVQVSLVMSNTFKSKQTFSYSLNNIKLSISTCISSYCNYKTYTALPMAHTLHPNWETDFG